jgi:dienelactone hydrolase
MIAVEKIRGPIFLVAGGADGVWPSAAYAAASTERARAHGKTGVTTLIYRRAGHALGAKVPYLPLATVFVLNGRGLDAGGETVADARARTDAWFKLLGLLDRS